MKVFIFLFIFLTASVGMVIANSKEGVISKPDGNPNGARASDTCAATTLANHQQNIFPDLLYLFE